MTKTRLQSAFTLTELAIVILIIGLVLAGLSGPMSRQFQQAQANNTQERLNNAREAVMAFAIANSRLPCPDRTGDGLEDRRITGDPAAVGCLANIYEGFLPWATLGIQQDDYWNNRLRYRVSAEFTRATNDASAATCGPNATNPNVCTFEVGDGGDIPLRDGQAGRPNAVDLMNPIVVPPSATVFAGGAVAVILSHGPNGLGATATDGTVRGVPAGGSDEALNGPAMGAIPAGRRLNSNPFIVRTPTDFAAGCADNGGGTLCQFDDQVVFIGVNTLISRLAQAGVRLQ